MVNLLIAIMGDTYTRVYDGMIEMDFKAMTQLVLEAEIVLSTFIGKNNESYYLQKCIIGSESEEISSNRLGFKIQKCIKDINSLSFPLEHSEDKLLQSIKEMRERKKNILDDMKNDLINKKKNILKCLDEKIIEFGKGTTRINANMNEVEEKKLDEHREISRKEEEKENKEVEDDSGDEEEVQTKRSSRRR